LLSNIDFIAYRKLKNININFNTNLNVIAGTNGTGKSSILHIISNSYKKITKSNPIIKNEDALKVINQMNKLANPKLETLTRGDNNYNDPAIGVKGTLFTCNYLNGKTLNFRRHNSEQEASRRFSVKPHYNKGAGDSLPSLPVIYLGLFRLFSYGEFSNDNLIKTISSKLPNEYLDLLSEHYFNFTQQQIQFDNFKSMGDIKNRANFTTNQDGIDSNTISAGEDNLFIILFALISLRFYFDSIISDNEVESILLIDEIDASLHPEFQIALFHLFLEYSQKYKIQVFMTSHSMTLLELALKKSAECNVVYLLDEIDSVRQMESPDIEKINMWLQNKTKREIYLNNQIPIISEDSEARIFLTLLFQYYKEKNEIDLNNIFHLVDANLSSEVIRNLVKDDYLLRTTLRATFILDGDQNGQEKLNKNLITLAGKHSPETICFNYSRKLYEDSETFFWQNDVLDNLGYTKRYFQSTILPEIKKIDMEIEAAKDKKSKKGMRRKKNKDLFKKYDVFWKLVLKDWIANPNNSDEVNKFFKNLNTTFKNTAEFHGVNPKYWDFQSIIS